MSIDEDPDDTKRICHRCVGEPYLRKEIAKRGEKHSCSFCGKVARTYTIEEMAGRVETAFEQHYERTSDQPTSLQYSMLSDRESDYNWERDGEPVVDAIANAADVSEDAARDIHAILEDRHSDFESATMGEETEFGDESYYEEKALTDHTWQEDWQAFETSLKTETRFFNEHAARHLESVFEGIEALTTKKGRTPIVEMGPGFNLTTLYRARVFQASDDLKAALARPDLNLGSPPSRVASAGRMNARGVSVFYAATSPDVALAEVRPPVGSRAIVGSFEITRPLRLLNLMALSELHVVGSIFDVTLASRMEKATFLRSLTHRISKPVMPNDEAFEYLPTQAVADFLSSHSKLSLDGIVFPSVQSGTGLNVVLFHKAARVEELALPPGTTVEAELDRSTEDGREADYAVYEEVPPTKTGPSDLEKHGFGDLSALSISSARRSAWNADHRHATLRVIPDSLIVHHVRAVKISTEEHSVRRRRSEKSDPIF